MTTLPAAAPAPTNESVGTLDTARIFAATVMHRRTAIAPGAVARTFRYGTCYWLVDVDRLPALPRWLQPFAQFRARDHLGDPAGTLSSNIRAELATAGLAAGRILLLTCPRVAGHVFNPLSVFYCFGDPASGARADDVRVIVAEVHNTYGGRHVYLLRPDGSDRDTVDKRFYVSPFLPMGGSYLMRTPVPGQRLAVSIALRQGGGTPFVATLTGAGRPATTRSVVRALLRWPFVTLRTAALIRWQGVRLWLRGVPVQPRPADAAGAEHAR